MKKFLLTLFGVLLALPILASDFNYTYKGQTLTYTVIDEAAKTCMTKEGEVHIAGNFAVGDLILPSNPKGYTLRKIGNYAFWYRDGLTSVTIPESVTSIGDYAFSGCSGLTSVIIPPSVIYIGSYAFEDCSGLKKCAYPKTGRNPFSYGISIAYNPEGAIIEDGWIYGPEKKEIRFAPCNLKGEYRIPETVESIAYGAFRGCSGLTSVTIPNSVTSIGDYAFSGCSGLTSVIIPPSVTHIGSYAFEDCSSLKKSAYPNTLENPFSNGVCIAYNPEGAIIEDGWIYGPEKKEIRFAPCNLKGEYRIPETVESIAYGAFRGCSGLTSVVVPYSVTSIGDYAFNGCSGFTEITIPENVIFIGDAAFGKCDNIKTINFNAENCTICGVKYLVFPKTIENINIGEKVKIIPSYAFEDMAGLTQVILPNSLTTIGRCAFYGCSGLTSVVIPNSVTEIGDGAFYGCSGLTSVVIPNSVTEIGSSAFYGCSGLTSVVIPNSVTEIGDGAFYGCSGLTSVVIPNSVTEIGSYAFYGCSDLKKSAYPNTLNNPFSYYGTSIAYNPEGAIIEDGWIYGPEKKEIIFAPLSLEGEYTIPESVESIGSYAFEDCSGLTSVIIGNSVKSIGSYAFRDCSSLTKAEFSSVEHLCSINFENPYANPLQYAHHLYINDEDVTDLTIPESVTEIGDYAFNGCSDLTSVVIPNSVTEIGSSAFSGCTGLTDVIFNAKNCTTCGSYDSPAFPSSIKTITIGENVKTIPSNAFRGCSGLTSVVIPNSVTSIGSSAFEYCRGLTSVIFGNSVETIGESAFRGCSGLTLVSIPESVETIGESAFNGCSSLTEVNFNAKNCTYCGSYDSPAFPNTTETIVLGEKVAVIPDNAFKGITGLSRITIPNSVISIGKSAFSGCNGLTMLTMGNNVESVGDEAFNGCSSLSKVKIDNINAWARITFADSYANPLFKRYSYDPVVGLYVGDDSELASSVVIEGNDPVGTYAFAGASFLEQVRVKDGAPVGNGAFASCKNLKRVCLNTPSVGNAAFNNCGALETIYSETTDAPSAPDDAFTKYNGVTLYVPRKCVSAYEDAPTCWYRFVSISAKDMNDLDEIFVPSYVNNEIPEIIPVSAIILNETALKLKVGETFQLEAEVMPADATDKDVVWSSSDPSCVSVDENGLLSAIAQGEATITVCSADGNVQATCMVTVVNNAGIEEVIATSGVVEVYDMRGVKVGESLEGLPKGIYIVCEGGKSRKVAL